MLTNIIFQGSAPHRGKCGMCVIRHVAVGQQENQLAESVTQPMGYPRSGVCLLFSGRRPQRTGPPMSVSRGWTGKEMTPDTHIANVFQAVLCQASLCYRVAQSQSPSKHSRLLHVVGMWETCNSGTAHRTEPLSRLMCEHSKGQREASSSRSTGRRLSWGESDKEPLKFPSRSLSSQLFSLSLYSLPLHPSLSLPPAFPFSLTPPSSDFVFSSVFYFEGALS